MRIKKIAIDRQISKEVGLGDVNIDRLGTLVALVGKNGSGKSRILNLIESNISSVINKQNIMKGYVSNLPNNIKQILKKLEPYRQLAYATFELEDNTKQRQLNPNDVNLRAKRSEIRQKIASIEKELQPNQNSVNRQVVGGVQQPAQVTPSQKMSKIFEELQVQIDTLHQKFIKRIEYSQIQSLQDVIDDAESDVNSFEQLVESVTEQLEYNELGSIYKSSLKFLRKLPNQLVSDWIESRGDRDKFEKRKSHKRFQSLKEIFEKIFGKTFDWDINNISKNITDKGVESLQNGIWKINDREFNYSEFSDGEKTLFAYVLMFFLMSQNNSIRLKDSILIIDEPELHLHPDAEIDLLNGIRDIIEENGQLFIATHSLNILANINYDEVFMVKNGVIKHPSNTIQAEALSELMKIEERVHKLTDFLNSISDWTYVRFMVECFTSPEVIEVANSDDPQVKSLKDILSKSDQQKKSLLLDFGAGKGRLYEQTMNESSFRDKIDYSALEPNELFHEDLKSKGVINVYSKYEQLTENTFDFIVLCNVLHEIDIDEWTSSINSIISSLNENGCLIIIEAKFLRKGEKIGTNGFLLLDEKELQVLFDLDTNPTTLHHKELSQKITCVLIEKSKLKHITHDKLIEAMKALEQNTFEKIYKLRTSSDLNRNSNSKGRLSAFLSQLNINARMALRHLNEQVTESTNR